MIQKELCNSGTAVSILNQETQRQIEMDKQKIYEMRRVGKKK